ncbi:MAG: hypothetical protein KZQ78_04245 [Candidatus Thiodiazotropha sp. (ex Ustalcina ferruginea)]|nr:hypothetical protein [Candidatus Thiodiazotropha sp. (ex Ustalcina ferruginea)]
MQIKNAWSSSTSTGDEYLDVLVTDAVGPVLDKAVNLLGLSPETIMVAWSASTQSISEVIEAIADSAMSQPTVLVRSGLTTNDVIETLPGIADIYVGTTDIP